MANSTTSPVPVAAPATPVVAMLDFKGGAFDPSNDDHITSGTAFLASLFTPDNKVPSSGSTRVAWGRSETAQAAFMGFVNRVGLDTVIATIQLNSCKPTASNQAPDPAVITLLADIREAYVGYLEAVESKSPPRVISTVRMVLDGLRGNRRTLAIIDDRDKVVQSTAEQRSELGGLCERIRQSLVSHSSGKGFLSIAMTEAESEQALLEEAA